MIMAVIGGYFVKFGFDIRFGGASYGPVPLRPFSDSDIYNNQVRF